MERNEVLVNFLAAFLVVILAVLLWLVFSDSRDGLSLMDAGPDSRVSRAYLTKSVRSGSKQEIRWGETGYENDSANIVTSVVVDYRVFDTFGEILVLLAASTGAGLLMEKRKKNPVREASPIVKTAVPLITLFILILGGYIIIHGHLSPGGGFPGGAVIASAFLLSYLAGGKIRGRKISKITETLAGLGIIALALAGLFLKGSLFENIFPSGSLGSLFSAYSILILYVLIGVKVSAELSSVIIDFLGD